MRNKVILTLMVVFLTLAMGMSACSSKTADPATQTKAVQPTDTLPPSVQPTATQPTAAQPTATQPAATQPAATQPPAAQATNTRPPAVQPTVTTTSAAADGAALLNQRCTVCHDLTRVQVLRGTADQWNQVVSLMVQRGAKLTMDEQKVLVAYLAKTYGP
jgi:hypothetical protein